MKVKMLQTMRGSPDGIRVFRYLEGEIYDEKSAPHMPESLASVFLSEKVAEVFDEEKAQKTVRETKVVTVPEKAVAEKTQEDKQVLSEAPYDVSLHTVSEVLEDARTGAITPEQAIREEKLGKNRTTLLAQLQELIADS